MSHFTVLVAAKDEEDLGRVLLPFHEYECTGMEEYTERLPIDLDDAEADFAKYANKPGADPQTLDEFVAGWYGLDEDDKDPDGIWRTKSNHRFYAWRNAEGRLLYYAFGDQELPGTKFPINRIEPTEEGDEVREYAIENVLNVEDAGLLEDFFHGLTSGLPVRDELTERIARKRSFVFPVGILQARDLTGPLKREFVKGRKWDWYVVGGRWSGTLHLKPGAAGETNTKISRLSEPNKNQSRADTALARDVDWESMRQEYIDHMSQQWEKWAALPPASQVDERRAAIRAADIWFFDHRWQVDIDGGMSKEDFLVKYGQAHALTFAFVTPQGQWVERGNMGWFAVVSDENDGYDKAWWDYVTSLPADQRLYVVDCHI